MITTIYKTHSSLLLKLLFALVMALLLFFSISEKSWALLAVSILATAIVVYIFRNTYYSISRHRLTIKSGFLFHETIDILNIRKVKEVHQHVFTGPGFSMRRLVIYYNSRDIVVISPDQRQLFIEHLKRINPDILIETKNQEQ